MNLVPPFVINAFCFIKNMNLKSLTKTPTHKNHTLTLSLLHIKIHVLLLQETTKFFEKTLLEP